MGFMDWRVQALLMEAFRIEELRELCLFDPAFRAIEADASAAWSRRQWVDAIVQCADQKQKFPMLLEWARQKAPLTYEKHRPYELDGTIEFFPTGKELIKSGESVPEREPTWPGRLDQFTWEMTSLKSELYALSQTVAKETVDLTHRVPSLESDPLGVVIPLLFFLRWRRGYRAGIEHILGLAQPELCLADFRLIRSSLLLPPLNGVVSAELSNETETEIIIMIDGQPVVSVVVSDPADVRAVLNSVSVFGQLIRDEDASKEASWQKLLDEIPIYRHLADADELTLTLVRNRHALFPLLARLGTPGSDWFLNEDEEQAKTGKSLLGNRPTRKPIEMPEELGTIEGQEGIEAISFHLQGKPYRPG